MNELIGMLQVEDQAKQKSDHSQSYTAVSGNDPSCTVCGKWGHRANSCWTAHPAGAEACLQDL